MGFVVLSVLYDVCMLVYVFQAQVGSGSALWTSAGQHPCAGVGWVKDIVESIVKVCFEVLFGSVEAICSGKFSS